MTPACAAAAGHAHQLPALPAWEAWDLAVVLHLLATVSTDAQAEDGSAASPTSVLQGNASQPFGGQYILQPSTDRAAVCSNATVLVGLVLCCLCVAVRLPVGGLPVESIHGG